MILILDNYDSFTYNIYQIVAEQNENTKVYRNNEITIEKISLAESFGIKDIIIDPGFGFSKTTRQNFDILNNLNFYKKLEKPILIGISRKSMIYNTLNIDPEEALNGSTVLHTISLLAGAKIIRTHDVKEAYECVKLVRALKS